MLVDPYTLGRSDGRSLGKRDGIRAAVTWLLKRAREMNDLRAKAILNSAAYSLGQDLKYREAGLAQSEQDLADELDATFRLFLHAMGDAEKQQAEAELRRRLWDNKAGIIAHLRAPASQADAKEALEKIAAWADVKDADNNERLSGEENMYGEGINTGLRWAGQFARAALTHTPLSPPDQNTPDNRTPRKP